MIKHWQTMHDYHCFLIHSKASFDSSERTRLHSQLWIPFQKLKLLDTDSAMDFLSSFYPPSGRPALNQPQILRSFVLFFLLFSMGLTPLSLPKWVTNLKSDRLLASLIGCHCHSLPPLGSYYDFIDRLWSAPSSDLYYRRKLLPAPCNSQKPEKPKGKGLKTSETKPKITEKLAGRLLEGKDILFNFEAQLQKLFHFVAVLPSLQCGLIPSDNLTVSGDGTAVHTHACPRGHLSRYFPVLPGQEPAASPVIFLIRTPPWDGTAISINTFLAILSSSSPVITANSTRTSLCFYASPAPGGTTPSVFSLLSMNSQKYACSSCHQHVPGFCYG